MGLCTDWVVKMKEKKSEAQEIERVRQKKGKKGGKEREAQSYYEPKR